LRGELLSIRRILLGRICIISWWGVVSILIGVIGIGLIVLWREKGLCSGGVLGGWLGVEGGHEAAGLVRGVDWRG
jgi:hypothetical protein